MRFLSAGYIFPISGPPIAGGILVMDDEGFVAEVLRPGQENLPDENIEPFDGILCPGFVNAHCHLELSWAKGLIESGIGLDGFLRALDELRHNELPVDPVKAIKEEGAEMHRSGVVAAGDICNSALTVAFKESSGMLFHNFVEVFASDPAKAEPAAMKGIQLAQIFRALQRNNRASVTPHAPYSVTEQLFRLIGFLPENTPVTIHHQESAAENRFFLNGSGSMAARRLYYNPGLAPFRPTGRRPFESIAPFLNPEQKILLVHNTFSEQEDIGFALQHFPGVAWCFCPNANLFIESRLPDIPLFVKNHCKIMLGTDSLASNRRLSILEEIKTISAHFPSIPLNELLTWATLNGAEFYGFRRLGSFEKGKKPGVVFINNPEPGSMNLTPASTSRLIIPA
ncbi:MAG TPA: amidohydrolase family protein [Bacteroidales bacterium]|nr:amidohydrolase family protein [Bacteroidales bacterium]HPT03183.1 amidohydrolase family protein [Bacteroidales bacterium]